MLNIVTLTYNRQKTEEETNKEIVEQRKKENMVQECSDLKGTTKRLTATDLLVVYLMVLSVVQYKKQQMVG